MEEELFEKLLKKAMDKTYWTGCIFGFIGGAMWMIVTLLIFRFI